MPEREELLAAAVGEVRPILAALYETAYARGMRAGMGRCETCRYWDNRGQLEDLAQFPGAHFALALAEWGNCDAINEELRPRSESDTSWIVPCQTHKDFGCVLWEQKDDEG